MHDNSNTLNANNAYLLRILAIFLAFYLFTLSSWAQSNSLVPQETIDLSLKIATKVESENLTMLSGSYNKNVESLEKQKNYEVSGFL